VSGDDPGTTTALIRPMAPFDAGVGFDAGEVGVGPAGIGTAARRTVLRDLGRAHDIPVTPRCPSPDRPAGAPLGARRARNRQHRQQHTPSDQAFGGVVCVVCAKQPRMSTPSAYYVHTPAGAGTTNTHPVVHTHAKNTDNTDNTDKYLVRGGVVLSVLSVCVPGVPIGALPGGSHRPPGVLTRASPGCSCGPVGAQDPSGRAVARSSRPTGEQVGGSRHT